MTTVFLSHKSEDTLIVLLPHLCIFPGIYRFNLKQTLETLIILPTHM